jgi:hypothetical protein
MGDAGPATAVEQAPTVCRKSANIQVFPPGKDICDIELHLDEHPFCVKGTIKYVRDHLKGKYLGFGRWKIKVENTTAKLRILFSRKGYLCIAPLDPKWELLELQDFEDAIAQALYLEVPLLEWHARADLVSYSQFTPVLRSMLTSHVLHGYRHVTDVEGENVSMSAPGSPIRILLDHRGTLKAGSGVYKLAILTLHTTIVGMCNPNTVYTVCKGEKQGGNTMRAVYRISGFQGAFRCGRHFLNPHDNVGSLFCVFGEESCQGCKDKERTIGVGMWEVSACIEKHREATSVTVNIKPFTGTDESRLVYEQAIAESVFTCIACQSRSMTRMARPCNHVLLCEECLPNVGNRCPKCRGVVQTWERVYL